MLKETYFRYSSTLLCLQPFSDELSVNSINTIFVQKTLRLDIPLKLNFIRDFMPCLQAGVGVRYEAPLWGSQLQMLQISSKERVAHTSSDLLLCLLLSCSKFPVIAEVFSEVTFTHAKGKKSNLRLLFDLTNALNKLYYQVHTYF